MNTSTSAPVERNSDTHQPDWNRPRIAIVGAGAVGLFYGAKLARSGCDVHFLLRSDYEYVREHGLEIHSVEENWRWPQVQAYNCAQAIGPCDLVIIALKSTNNAALPALLPPLLHEHTALLTLQNGLGNEEFLAENFGGHRVLGGVCFVCLNRISPGVVRHQGHSKIEMGEFSRTPQERTHAMAQLFVKAGVPCEVGERLDEVLWRKLVWNIPFNGLAMAAAGRGEGADVAQILGDPDLRHMARTLMEEVVEAARALGMTIPQDFVEFQFKRSVIMGAYRPSSLIDYQEGREVEVEAIWGETLRRGQASGLAMPRLEMLYHLIQWLVRQRASQNKAQR